MLYFSFIVTLMGQVYDYHFNEIIWTILKPHLIQQAAGRVGQVACTERIQQGHWLVGAGVVDS